MRGKGRSAARAPSSRAGLLASGAMGFVAGAVCWHIVGFWGFLTEAVFYARPEGGPARVARVNGGKAAARVPVQDEAAANCSMAVRAPDGDIEPVACGPKPMRFLASRNIARADRGDFGPATVPTLISGEGVGVGGWSARIEPGEPDKAGAGQ